MNFRSNNAEEMENYVDDSIIYVTLNNKIYKLLNYRVCDKCNIVQTFRRKDSYQGAAITFKDKGESILVIDLQVKNLINGRYEGISVFFNSESMSFNVKHHGVGKNKLDQYIKMKRD